MIKILLLDSVSGIVYTVELDNSNHQFPVYPENESTGDLIMKIKTLLRNIFLASAAVLFFPAGILAAEAESLELFAMDTYMTFTAYGGEAGAALAESQAEIERLDALLAAQNAESEVAGLNRNGGGEASEDTLYLVKRAKELREETGGAFDIAIYPVIEAWGFPSHEYTIPEDTLLQQELPLADSSLISVDGDEIHFGKEGMKIELGAIAKGYASQRISEIFADHEVTGIISLGGNVQSSGKKPDHTSWKVGIRMPGAKDAESGVSWLSEDSRNVQAGLAAGLLGIVSSHDEAVITSGVYERYFVKDGKLYHHILDPGTGYPVDNGLVSVTVICPDGTTADGLATALFVMGKEGAEEFWRNGPESFDMILLEEDGTLSVTEGIEDRFQSPMEYEIIEK